MFRPWTHFRDGRYLQRATVVLENLTVDGALLLAELDGETALCHFFKHIHDGNGGPERGRQSDDFGLSAGECDFSLELGFPEDWYTCKCQDISMTRPSHVNVLPSK